VSPTILRAEAHAIAGLIRVAVRILPLPRIAALLAHLPRTRRTVSSPGECASAAADGARRVTHPTCLYTALTAFALLARRGHAPSLVIGAARVDGFDAHAWVIVGGAPVMAGRRDYTPLWSYAASPAGAR
jgi:hypothetical protein